MTSILERVDMQANVFGVDTETYNDNGECGLLSIQVVGELHRYYFHAKSYEQPANDIRNEICEQFFNWIETLRTNSVLAFFNMDYDVSQFLHYMICDAGYEYTDNHGRGKGELKTVSILESDITMYKVSLVNSKGSQIKMIDIAKFLTGTNLNTASKEWLNDCKIELNPTPSDDWLERCITDMKVKSFKKALPNATERDYAMKDAELTLRLYQKLCQSEVIEKEYITIAGRTIGHFKDYLMDNYGIRFNTFAYGTDDNEIVDACTARNELLMRPSLRGGICRANRTGYFTDVTHIDAKSHYPSQMSKPHIPFGPILEDRPSTDYERLIYPRGYLVRKPGKLPYIQWKSKAQCFEYAFKTEYEPGEYVNDCYLDGTYMFWGFEWDLVLECYDFIEMAEPTIYYIEMAKNDTLKPYVQRLYEGKQNNTGTKRYYYKILLNSLYGKFLSRPDGMKISYANRERVKLEEDGRQTYYLPLGSFVATGGRVDLMKAMLSLPIDDVLYCDTDSIIYKGDKQPNIKIGKNLGEWGIEQQGIECWIVGPKTYQERINDGTIVTKCAGLSKSVMGYVPFGELKEGLVVPCLKAHRDPDDWSISLRQTTYEVSTKARRLRGD